MLRKLCVLLLFLLFPLTASAQVRTWKDATGKFSVNAELVRVDGQTAILKTEQGRQIKVPLAKLSDADRAFVERLGEPPAPMPMHGDRPTGRAAITKALSQPATLEFVDTPLKDVVTHVRKFHNLQIIINQPALDEIGIGVDTPINVSVKKNPLGEALTAALTPAELTHVIRHDVLWITTLEEVEATPEVRVYKLLKRFLADDLIEHVTENVHEESWIDFGGPGDLMMLGQTLVVFHTPAVHAVIEKKYADIMTPLTPPPPARARNKVAAALASPTAMEFIETPLTDVVDYLAELHDVAVRVDKDALDAIGYRPDVEVSSSVTGVSLAHGLSILLEPMDLTWTIDDKGLVVTSPEKSETMLIDQAHPAGDIVAALGGNAELLQEAVTSLVAPDMWDAVGGPGTAKFDARGNLVVSQTPQVHRQIDDLLRTLRAGK